MTGLGEALEIPKYDVTFVWMFEMLQTAAEAAGKTDIMFLINLKSHEVFAFIFPLLYTIVKLKLLLFTLTWKGARNSLWNDVTATGLPQPVSSQKLNPMLLQYLSPVYHNLSQFDPHKWWAMQWASQLWACCHLSATSSEGESWPKLGAHCSSLGKFQTFHLVSIFSCGYVFIEGLCVVWFKNCLHVNMSCFACRSVIQSRL